MTNVTNCEQYVLAELDCEKRRNERLAAENDKLSEQLDAMTKLAESYKEALDRPKTPIEVVADEVMRQEMLTRFSYAEVTGVQDLYTGKLLDFDEWCHQAVRLKTLPDGISEEELIGFMSEDLRTLYDYEVHKCTKQKMRSADVEGLTDERIETVGNRD